MATVTVTQPAATVTLELTQDEAVYVAGVLGNSSQYHTSLQEFFPLERGVESVWDKLMDALEAIGAVEDHGLTRTSPLYAAASRLVSFTPPKP